MKKLIKWICWILLIVFIALVLLAVMANGGFGGKAQYYYLKTVYHIGNPENKPSAEIVIDLNQGRDFILTHSEPNGYWFHPYGWWTSQSAKEQEERAALKTFQPPNPFQYFKIKIIWDDTTLIIPNAQKLYIEFKDFRYSEYREKYPNVKGINSVQIVCLDCEPVLENGHVLRRKADYDFALAQHQKISSMFANPQFVRDVQVDEVKKEITNQEMQNFNVEYLEYKTWSKGNFKFTMMLKHSDKEYFNNIYISPKDRL